MGRTITRAATDAGGTFTALVCVELDTGTGKPRVISAKSDTTPPEFERGVLNVMEKARIEPDSIDFLAHGTTVVINALTERKGARVGLITTAGFRDLEIARGNRPDFFNLRARARYSTRCRRPRYEIELRVYDLIWRCLAQHMPERSYNRIWWMS